ncbi:MAG: hypothetical protein M0042_14150 [Nitrospiraceae bacterium]|nr:hypothetical protein [Nitrospiraceae bacterium]
MRLHSVILLLSFALLIQNTCPRGYAGKSMVSPACGHAMAHCHMKPGTPAASDQKGDAVAQNFSSHSPFFLFAVVQPVHIFRPEPVAAVPAAPETGYIDAFPDELLRPPRA